MHPRALEQSWQCPASFIKAAIAAARDGRDPLNAQRAFSNVPKSRSQIESITEMLRGSRRAWWRSCSREVAKNQS
jgi:hypothetical protein